MNLEDYRIVFVCCSLVLILIIAVPTLGLIVPFPRNSQRFSELWILGPNNMTEDYPLNVAINEKQNIFVGVGNHLGRSSYYVVYVKLRNQTQAAPNMTTFTPSPLAPLYEFRFVIADGDTWKTPVVFSFLEASRSGDLLNVTKISINDAVFSVKSLSMRDSHDTGFYYQLFFELWIYDESISSFSYHNRFVGIWLNVTA